MNLEDKSSLSLPVSLAVALSVPLRHISSAYACLMRSDKMICFNGDHSPFLSSTCRIIESASIKYFVGLSSVFERAFSQ